MGLRCWACHNNFFSTTSIERTIIVEDVIQMEEFDIKRYEIVVAVRTDTLYLYKWLSWLYHPEKQTLHLV